MTVRAHVPGARLAGLAGLGFVLGLILQNAVFLVGAPEPSASTESIVSYYTENATKVGLAVGLVTINLVFLVTFVAGAAGWMQQKENGTFWARIALAGVVLTGATFVLATVFQAVLAASMDRLAADPALLTVVWDLHTAAFAIVGAGLGLLVTALAVGGQRTGLAPRWAAVVGTTGGALLIAGGVATYWTTTGAPTLYLNMAGFVGWVVFLITSSLRLVRASRAEVSTSRSASLGA